MKNILFIGNFVNDVILIHQNLKLSRETSFTDFMNIDTQKQISKNYTKGKGDVTKTEALGGSVTYGSLAAHYFGDTKSTIVTTVASDINKEFKSLIQSKDSIDLSFTNIKKNGSDDDGEKNTSYYLNYYNNKKNRTLSLIEKGHQVDIQSCIKCIESVYPDALLFVPVAGEFDENLVMETLDIIGNMNKSRGANGQERYSPIIAFDVQGFLRSFNGNRVTTRPMHIMIQKLISIKMSLDSIQSSNGGVNDIITVVKAEYGEAAAIMGEHDPATCAKLLRTNFGFTIVTVTMGGDGLFVSSSITGELYIPTFKPDQVCDETGCGDTFLTCLVLELLNLLKSKNNQQQSLNHGNNSNNNNNNNGNGYIDDCSWEKPNDILIKKNIKKEELVQCLQVGSSGASFLVEKMGPNGFASREKILDRVLVSGIKQVKQQYSKYNQEQSTDHPNINPQPPQQDKPYKSTTNYK